MLRISDVICHKIIGLIHVCGAAHNLFSYPLSVLSRTLMLFEICLQRIGIQIKDLQFSLSLSLSLSCHMVKIYAGSFAFPEVQR